MRFLVIYILCFISLAATGQQVSIKFQPSYGEKPVVLEEFYHFPGKDSVSFDVIRFYISDVVLYKGDEIVYKEKDSYHLIDVSDEATMSIQLKLPAKATYDKIGFHLGIDSVTSTSGALSGDLDPGKGMFWTWQSGYINCKIEGRSNLCPTRHHDFGLHLGGYAAPDLAMQEIILPATSPDIMINIPLDKFISMVNLGKDHSIMSPGPQAVALSKKLAAIFVVK